MDTTDQPVDTTEITCDTTSDVKSDITTDTKTDRKRRQLAEARESLRQKKKQKEVNLLDMKSQLDSITSILKSKTDSTDDVPLTHHTKPQRVTAVNTPDDTTDDDENSWYTSAVRTGALLTLAAGSFYFNNMYGKAPKKKRHATRPSPLQTPTSSRVQFTQPNTVQPRSTTGQIGKSGFVL